MKALQIQPASDKTQQKLQGFCGCGSCSDRVHCPGATHISMLRRTLISAFMALAATSLAALPASAQRGRDDDRRDRGAPEFQQGSTFPGSQLNAPVQERAPQREVSLNVVLRNLKSQYGGEHLDARKDGNRYIISWITAEGRRLTIEVDAANGRVLSTR